MKNEFVLKELTTENIVNELENIGFDDSYKKVASAKYKFKVLKIYDLTLPQANILKQTALSLGTDCAVHRDVLTGNVSTTDAILSGSEYQLQKLAEKLKAQPFSLTILAEKILTSLNRTTSKTKIVGILNVTPDSFTDGNLYYKSEDAIKKMYSLVEDGADIIDIGAESTRPGFTDISADEQIKRLAPVLKELKNIAVPISVDTRSSVVADFALNNGASIINDVSGMEYDKNIADVVKKYNATIVVQNCTRKNLYSSIIDDTYYDLHKKIITLQEKQIENIIVDIGIGFGKNQTECLTLLNRIEEFFSLNVPIMVGLSRKSCLGMQSADNAEKDTMTLALSYPLIQKGINYLRVHNVKLHKQLLALAN